MTAQFMYYLLAKVERFSQDKNNSGKQYSIASLMMIQHIYIYIYIYMIYIREELVTAIEDKFILAQNIGKQGKLITV